MNVHSAITGQNARDVREEEEDAEDEVEVKKEE